MTQNINLSGTGVTFPVIKKNKSKISFMQGIMITIIGMLMLYLIIYKTQFDSGAAVNIVSIVLFLLFIVVAVIFNFFVQKFRFGGEFTITDNSITLTTTNKSRTYMLNEITGLKLSYAHDADNMAAPVNIKKWLFGSSDKNINMVEFVHNGDLHSIEIYLKSKKEIEIFQAIAKQLNSY